MSNFAKFAGIVVFIIFAVSGIAATVNIQHKCGLMKTMAYGKSLPLYYAMGYCDKK